MTDLGPGSSPADVQLLLHRVDQLVAVVAAMDRASRRSRKRPTGTASDRVSEQEVIDLWDALTADIDYLRALASALHVEVEACEDRLAHKDRELMIARAEAETWRAECVRVRDHRDDVVAQLVSVQGSRWMRLGRRLGVGRAAKQPSGDTT